jgi:hypothetical protein
MLIYTGTMPTSSGPDIAGNIGARTSRNQYAYDLNRPRVPGAITVTAHRPQNFSSTDLEGRPNLVRDIADHIEAGAVEVLDFGTEVSGQNGAAATMAAASGGLITVTGLTGMVDPDSEGRQLVISGATTSANNGTFDIVEYVSATSVTIAAGSAPGADASNGSLVWSEVGAVADRSALEAYL